MKHGEVIRKYLGINTPDWVIKNVQNAIDEVLQDYIDNRYICGIDPISSEKGSCQGNIFWTGIKN